jgi:PhnB protein
MPKNPPDGYQRIIPYLLYDDAPAAIDFICNAFGFEERFRMPGPDGKLGHCEVGYEGNVLMLASAMPEMGHVSPKDLPGRSNLVLVYVNDVGAHYEHAKAAGANVQSEPTDEPYGDRSYSAIDPEGMHWYFNQHVRDVPHDEPTGS